MRQIKNHSGLTLVEIIVALAILGIMAVSFLTMFSSGYSTIFAMGRKTQAMNEKAQYYMDSLYLDYDAGIASINADPLVSVTEDKTSTTYSGIGLNVVTITVEYPTGRTVSLTSLVPKGS